MAQYTGLQSLLNASLGEYHAKGFRLVEPDDHTLVLFYQDEQVAVFNAQAALIPAIHRAYAQWLEKVGEDAKIADNMRGYWINKADGAY